MQELKKPPVTASPCQPPFQGGLGETVIRLPEETVNYLERLDYELGGLQVLHTHALKAGVPLEQRMEIRRQYQETFAEYQLAKREMWAEFDAEYPNARWWVDFQSGELHVECGVGQRAGQCPAPTDAAGVGAGHPARPGERTDAAEKPPAASGPPPFHKGGKGCGEEGGGHA